MKKTLFVFALAASGLTMPLVSAQDYCCPPQCDPCCYGADFNGFYIGGNLGVISHTAHRNDLDGFLTDNSGWSTIDTDFTAGLQLGYDWQCNSTLVGLVWDWNWVNIEHRVRDNANADVDNFINSDFDWFSTIRLRAGVTVCDALIYVTAGAAAARHETRWFADDTGSFRHNNTRWGWAGGVGTEFLLGCNWSLGAEVLFLQFANKNRSATFDDETYAFGHSDSAFVGRILLNYRFGDLFDCCW